MIAKVNFSMRNDVLVAKLPKRFCLDNQRTPSNKLSLELIKGVDDYRDNCVKQSLAPLVFVDLGDCEYIDSTGLGALVVIMRKITAQCGDLVLVNNVSSSIQSLFGLTRMNRIFELLTMEQALEKFPRSS